MMTTHRKISAYGYVEETGQFNENGEKQGNWFYYTYKSLKECCFYSNGKKQGPAASFYCDGELYSIIVYCDDQPVEFSYYYKNGKLQQKGRTVGNITSLVSYHSNGEPVGVHCYKKIPQMPIVFVGINLEFTPSMIEQLDCHFHLSEVEVID
jgi:antitoxin component YwqK of YwqJK toxin-antitoxin module